MKALLLDIYRSARLMPLWVQVWVFFILIPANLAGLFFWSDPIGKWIGILGVAGMAPNVWLMFTDRGFTHKMALPHLAPWTILVVWLAMLLWTGALTQTNSIWTLAITVLVVDTVSLAFDYRDSWVWYKARTA